MLGRHLTPMLLAALRDTPVVFLHGPRQCGKSTLVRSLSKHGHPATYLTLDDAAVLSAARRDPDAFIRAQSGPVIIDEVQVVPDLLRAIKLEVDRQRSAGRFLLTGSANVLLLPKVSESLAGRMQVLNLWPFSQGELVGVRERLIDRVFETDDLGGMPQSDRFSGDRAESDWLGRAIAGGYPEIIERSAPDRRRAWFGAYLTTILQRDIRALAEIEGLTELPRLLALLAAQSGGLLNIAELARDFALSQPAVKRYLTLLQAAHLYQPLSAWTGNRRKRLMKSPRVFLNDTGLHAYLIGLDEDRARDRSTEIGRLLEAFVYQELRKQITWSSAQPALYYYRTYAGREVDFVLERRNRQVVGIEVKSAVKLNPHDWKGLADLADAAGKHFHAGILLYGGPTIVPAGPKLWAIPLSVLFGG